jgi:pimeloyl-ACP methyl ester carboxylesterase
VVSRVLPNGGSLTDLLRPAFADHDDPNALMLHYFHAVEATARIGWNPFLHDPKLADRLPFVTAPTLVLYGTDDGIVPRAHADAYAVEIPTARLELLPGSGHLPALERPAEVAAAIAAFTQGS